MNTIHWNKNKHVQLQFQFLRYGMLIILTYSMMLSRKDSICRLV